MTPYAGKISFVGTLEQKPSTNPQYPEPIYSLDIVVDRPVLTVKDGISAYKTEQRRFTLAFEKARNFRLTVGDLITLTAESRVNIWEKDGICRSIGEDRVIAYAQVSDDFFRR